MPFADPDADSLFAITGGREVGLEGAYNLCHWSTTSNDYHHHHHRHHHHYCHFCRLPACMQPASLSFSSPSIPGYRLTNSCRFSYVGPNVSPDRVGNIPKSVQSMWCLGSVTNPRYVTRFPKLWSAPRCCCCSPTSYPFLKESLH